MKVLSKIGDAYANNEELRDKIKQALEDGGLVTAIQSETGLVVMEEIEKNDEQNV